MQFGDLFLCLLLGFFEEIHDLVDIVELQDALNVFQRQIHAAQGAHGVQPHDLLIGIVAILRPFVRLVRADQPDAVVVAQRLRRHADQFCRLADRKKFFHKIPFYRSTFVLHKGLS